MAFHQTRQSSSFMRHSKQSDEKIERKKKAELKRHVILRNIACDMIVTVIFGGFNLFDVISI